MARQDEWMEKLVKNYQIPEQKEKETPKRMLTEEQKKIISNKK
jgi:hypothetical protein